MLDAGFCVGTLPKTIALYSKPKVMNGDQGSQYMGTDCIMTLTMGEIKISMDRSGPLRGQHLHRTSRVIIKTEGRLPARNHWRVQSRTDHR